MVFVRTVKMRDPKRIKRILKLLQEIWTKHPDLRLTQVIGNCFNYGDLYYIEDENLEDGLKGTYNVQ